MATQFLKDLDQRMMQFCINMMNEKSMAENAGATIASCRNFLLKVRVTLRTCSSK